MSNALLSKNKMAFVDGSLKKLDESSPDQFAWRKCNSLVITWLFNSLAWDLHDNVAYVDCFTDIWHDPEESFSQRNTPRIFHLKRELALIRKDNFLISAYFTKLKSLWDELSVYFQIPSCTCGSCTWGATKEFMADKE
ncbi:PREDICTED: uncharacterized protein LOC109115092 [Nelumbo nucifera]|uniref:Uncharacterized protein LOC109115092 n=1 Tax=Nelumbo nucifera TaxID=4432 RepID=A0A1U8Q8B0_NELNU|nr:PREDICTED: uncharacterized protein LOC109115092 [Nelumbo nucifera]